MLLYDSQVSGNCYKVRLLLAQLGSPRAAGGRRRDRSNGRELLGELNPGLRVPTLVFDDGRSLGESGRDHLVPRGRTPQYLPEDDFERAQVLQWMFFEQYSHEPNIAVARFLVKVAGSRPPAEARIEALQRGRVRRARRDGASPRQRLFLLVGERYSIADIALYAYTHVAARGRVRPVALPRDRRVARARRRAARPHPDHSLERGARSVERRRVGAAEPAVDQERRGGHVARLVAGEEQRGAGDLLGAREAAHRHVHEPPRGLLGVLGVQLLQQRRVDRARGTAR